MTRKEVIELLCVAQVPRVLVKASCPFVEPYLDASTLLRAIKSRRRAGLNLIIELWMLRRDALEVVLLSIRTGFRA